MNSDSIARELRSLIDEKNDVTFFDLSGSKIDVREARLLAEFLVSDNCVVANLDLSNNDLASFSDMQCIIDAIGRNRSIIHLDLSRNHTEHSFDNFVDKLAVAIHHHPCIRAINLASNKIIKSTLNLAKHMPKSLKHIDLSSNRYMDHANLGYLLEHSKLASIEISNVDPGFILKGLEDKLINNRSLISFEYNYYNVLCDHLINEKMTENIKLMVLLNRRARGAALNAALCLVAIRRFRKDESGVLGLVPKEIVLMIARDVFASYTEDEWRMSVVFPNKRMKC